jgi:hypothetical protein
MKVWQIALGIGGLALTLGAAGVAYAQVDDPPPPPTVRVGGLCSASSCQARTSDEEPRHPIPGVIAFAPGYKAA